MFIGAWWWASHNDDSQTVTSAVKPKSDTVDGRRRLTRKKRNQMSEHHVEDSLTESDDDNEGWWKAWGRKTKRLPAGVTVVSEDESDQEITHSWSLGAKMKEFAEEIEKKVGKVEGDKVFEEDYWLPEDPTELVVVPPDQLSTLSLIMPHKDKTKELCSFGVYEWSWGERTLWHVVFHMVSRAARSRAVSLYRTPDRLQAFDLFHSCTANERLFRLIEKLENDRKSKITDLLAKLKHHRLWKAVHIAARMGMKEYFADKKQIDDESLTRELKTRCHPEGMTALMLAVQGKEAELVKLLMDMGADPLAVDFNGNHIFHFAAVTSVDMLDLLWSYESVRVLLNRPNNEGSTPMLAAVKNGNGFCVTRLATMGASLKAGNPLFAVMQSKHTTASVIKAMLAASPDLIDQTDPETGNSLLHLAMFKQPIVALFCSVGDERRVYMNRRNLAGLTPLHIYVHRDDLSCVLALASRGCDLDATDSACGDTALHMAVSKGNLVLTRTLLCLGADPNIANNGGDTPLHVAAQLAADKQVELVRSLEMCGAVRCSSDRAGCRPCCVYKEHIGMDEKEIAEETEAKGHIINFIFYSSRGFIF